MGETERERETEREGDSERQTERDRDRGRRHTSVTFQQEYHRVFSHEQNYSLNNHYDNFLKIGKLIWSKTVARFKQYRKIQSHKEEAGWVGEVGVGWVGVGVTARSLEEGGWMGQGSAWFTLTQKQAPVMNIAKFTHASVPASDNPTFAPLQSPNQMCNITSCVLPSASLTTSVCSLLRKRRLNLQQIWIILRFCPWRIVHD